MYYYDHRPFKKIFKDGKNILVLLAILLSAARLFAQPVRLEQAAIDSLKTIINGNTADTAKVHALYWLSRTTTLSNTGESVELANEGLDLARKIKFPIGQLECLEALSFSYAITSSFEKGFDAAYQSIDLSKKHAPVREVFGINMMGLLYQKLGDDKESLKWAQKAYYHPRRKQADHFTQWSAMFLLAQEHERLNNLDSSDHFATETRAYSKLYFPFQESWAMLILARINSKLKKYDEAVNFCKQILQTAKGHEGFFENEVANELAQIYFNQGKTDSAQQYASATLAGATQFKNYLVIMNSSNLLSLIYEKTDPVKAYDFLKISTAAKDTVTNIEKTKQVKQLEIKEKQRIEDLNLAVPRRSRRPARSPAPARARGRCRRAGAGRPTVRAGSGWRSLRQADAVERLRPRASRRLSPMPFCAQRRGDDRADGAARVERRHRVLEDHLQVAPQRPQRGLRADG